MDRRSRDSVSRFCSLTMVVLLASTVAMAGLATAAAGPTVSVSDAEITPGETTTTTISLSAAPNGVAGYNLTVHLENDGAQISEAAINDAFGLTEVSKSDDGRTVVLRAVDLEKNIEAGSGSVELATLSLTGDQAGAASLTLSPVSVDDDDGNKVNPAVESGSSADGDGANGGSSSGSLDLPKMLILISVGGVVLIAAVLFRITR